MSAVAKQMRGTLKQHESLARYTSWRVGGQAERFYQPADKDDLIEYIQSVSIDEQLFFMGMGSNVLIREGGIKGTVINLRGCLNELRIESEDKDHATIYAEAGAGCSQLARFAVKQGLSGSEFLAGIPGSIGGALSMNAGCYGSETWQFVENVETIDRTGETRIRKPQDYSIAYRSVQHPSVEWFISANFRFVKSEDCADRERIKELLKQRATTQPVDSYSCGSVFRNPPGHFAAKLIESCDLKGFRIGGAHISNKHANFILNDANASASDIEQLILYIQEEVQANTGILLQPEVKIIGEKA